MLAAIVQGTTPIDFSGSTNLFFTALQCLSIPETPHSSCIAPVIVNYWICILISPPCFLLPLYSQRANSTNFATCSTNSKQLGIIFFLCHRYLHESVNIQVQINWYVNLCSRDKGGQNLKLTALSYIFPKSGEMQHYHYFP
jgi:hypothetical protein